MASISLSEKEQAVIREQFYGIWGLAPCNAIADRIANIQVAIWPDVPFDTNAEPWANYTAIDSPKPKPKPKGKKA